MTELRLSLANLTIATSVVAMLAFPSCGGGFYGSNSTGPTMDVRGNVADVLPAGTDRDIVVFVFTTDFEQVDCENPVLPDDDTQYQSRTVKPGETEFEVRNAKAGYITIAFLLDEPGNDSDGRIDPGDPVALLNDPDCVTADVPNKYIVFAEDVDINFGLTSPAGFPAPGRAEAADLYEEPE